MSMALQEEKGEEHVGSPPDGPVVGDLEKAADRVYETVADDVEQFFQCRDAAYALGTSDRSILAEGRIEVYSGEGVVEARYIGEEYVGGPGTQQTTEHQYRPLDRQQTTTVLNDLYAPIAAAAATVNRSDDHGCERVREAVKRLDGEITVADADAVFDAVHDQYAVEQGLVSNRTVYRADT